MEEEKLQRLHDTLAKLRKSAGLGTASHYSWATTVNEQGERADGLPDNALYSNFVKEGSYDPTKKNDGDGRDIKRNFDDIAADRSSDSSSSSSEDSAARRERKRRRKEQKKAERKAAKLEQKRQAKLAEKKRAKKQAKKLARLSSTLTETSGVANMSDASSEEYERMKEEVASDNRKVARASSAFSELSSGSASDTDRKEASKQNRTQSPAEPTTTAAAVQSTETPKEKPKKRKKKRKKDQKKSKK